MYLLTEDEYKKAFIKQDVLSDDDIRLYLKKIPHFGPVTIEGIITYMRDDGLLIVRNRGASNA